MIFCNARVHIDRVEPSAPTEEELTHFAFVEESSGIEWCPAPGSHPVTAASKYHMPLAAMRSLP